MIRMDVETPAPGGGNSAEAQFQVYGTQPQITAVVNSASYAQGTLAPGDIICIFGLGLGPSDTDRLRSRAPPIPTVLPAASPSTSVTINGTRCANSVYQRDGCLRHRSLHHLRLFGASGGVLRWNAHRNHSRWPWPRRTPGFIRWPLPARDKARFSISIRPRAIILSIRARRPRRRGSEVVIYITGAGATTSVVDNLLIPLSPAVTPMQSSTVTIGGQGATLLGAQAPLGSTPGLMQTERHGAQRRKARPALPLCVTIGGIQSQTGLTMAVK